MGWLSFCFSKLRDARVGRWYPVHGAANGERSSRFPLIYSGPRGLPWRGYHRPPCQFGISHPTTAIRRQSTIKSIVRSATGSL